MIRNISQNDISDVLYIQKSVYSSLLVETPESIQSKISTSPETCFLKISNNQIIAYCLAYPYAKYNIPSLNSLLNDLPLSTNLFLHDLAVLPHYSGKGIASKILSHLFAVIPKMGFTSITLVAVQNSQSFWKKFGFRVAEGNYQHSSYGKGAVIMFLHYIPNN